MARLNCHLNMGFIRSNHLVSQLILAAFVNINSKQISNIRYIRRYFSESKLLFQSIQNLCLTPMVQLHVLLTRREQLKSERICATKLPNSEHHSNVHHYESSAYKSPFHIHQCMYLINIMKVFGCGCAEIGLVKITKYNQTKRKWNEIERAD